jgi:hypothetical protein
MDEPGVALLQRPLEVVKCGVQLPKLRVKDRKLKVWA